MTTNPSDGPIHTWFGLSYCNYQVLHRTLMQSMPLDWQQRMVACLEELHAAFEHVPQAEVYDVKAATEHIVGEMTDSELAKAGIEADWYGGETPPEGLSAEDFGEWREQHEQDAADFYRIGDGDEVDRHSRVLLAASDPVPHYNRGRTYIEPQPRTPATTPQPAAAEEHPDDAARRFARRLVAVERLCSGRPGYHTLTVKQVLTAISDADDEPAAGTGQDGAQQ
ncbi:hypothetical protein [Streptomyces sp. NPDC055058]